MAWIKIKAPKCNMCGHVWLPRKQGEIPVCCAKCKSPRWNAR